MEDRTKEIMDNDLPGGKEIALKLQERTTEELLVFQRKLKRMKKTHQVITVRSHLIHELLYRHLSETAPS